MTTVTAEQIAGLVERLDDLSTLEPGWYANVGRKTGEQCCDAMRQAAQALTALQERVEGLERERDKAPKPSPPMPPEPSDSERACWLETTTHYVLALEETAFSAWGFEDDWKYQREKRLAAEARADALYAALREIAEHPGPYAEDAAWSRVNFAREALGIKA